MATPALRYTGFYYSQIRQALLDFKRRNASELTNEDPHDPTMLWLEMDAYVGHLAGCLLDHQAQEGNFLTLRLRESLRAFMALIGETLEQDVPSTTDMVLTLKAPLAAPVAEALRERTGFKVPPTADASAMSFEVADAVDLTATNVPTAVYEYSGAAYTDVSAAFNGGPMATIWSPAPVEGDLLYVGHSEVMFGEFEIHASNTVLPFVIANIDSRAIEYYDGQFSSENPTSVQIVGATLKVDLTSFLGAHDRHGASVVIRSLVTGTEETVVSTWDGVKNYGTTTTWLSQAAPSTDAGRYLVLADWREPDNLVLHESFVSGTTTHRLRFTYTLPETTERSWPWAAVNGVGGQWMRIRVVRAAANAVDLAGGAIDEGEQYLRVLVTQGQTAIEDPLDSTTGLPSQEFTSATLNVIAGSVIFEVDEGAGFVEWTLVEDFLGVLPTIRAYVLSYDSSGRAVIRVGDGTTGYVPATGVDNVRLTCRFGANEDGNVGAGEIRTLSGSSAYFGSVWNPRAAVGWAAAEGSTSESVEEMKTLGPARLRAQRRALTLQDIETLAVDWESETTGTKPVARAIAQMFTAKTTRLVVVGKGGAPLSAALLSELETYFNGDVNGYGGLLVINNRVVSTNYTPYAVAITATVTRRAVNGVLPDATALKNLVLAFLDGYVSPLAQRDDGTYEHVPGDSVTVSRIQTEIFNAYADAIKKVVVAVPAADLVLGATELPDLLTTPTITIV